MEDINYDIVIVSHELDFHKIKFVIQQAEKNLEFDEIHLILSEREEFEEKETLKRLTSRPVFYHKETDILKIDKSKLKMFNPSWIYQMMLKFFQDVTKNDNYLVIESDAVISSKLEFFNNGKTIFYISTNDQNHQPYFNFSKKILNLGREYSHTFISECMMYNKNYIKELLSKCNCEDSNDFMELLYNNVDNECYPADYELYGNFCYKYHGHEFEIRPFSILMNGKYTKMYPNVVGDIWSDQEIMNIIDFYSNKYDLLSFHTWKS